MRKTPHRIYNDFPCSMVAVGCALGEDKDKVISRAIGLKNDGYLTLDNMNKYIRSLLDVQKKEYFKRGERMTLEELLKGNERRAVVCLLGHYVYIDHEDYWSFFKNEMDEVVCIWWLKEGCK